MDALTNILLVTITILVALMAIGLILARMYKRASNTVINLTTRGD